MTARRLDTRRAGVPSGGVTPKGAREALNRFTIRNVASRRLVASRLSNNVIIAKLFKTVAPKYVDRKGGYSRIIKLSDRMSDGSKMAAIELV